MTTDIDMDDEQELVDDVDAQTLIRLFKLPNLDPIQARLFLLFKGPRDPPYDLRNY